MQNQGKAILFTLNTDNKELFSFENSDHSFSSKFSTKFFLKKEVEVYVDVRQISLSCFCEE